MFQKQEIIKYKKYTELKKIRNELEMKNNNNNNNKNTLCKKIVSKKPL